MTEQRPEPTNIVQRALAISRRVQIKGIWLARSETQRNVGWDCAAEAVELQTGVKIDHRFDDAHREIHVMVSFLAAGHESAADGERPNSVFRVEAAFAILYAALGDEACDPSDLDAFARMNGVYNAWPYWREFLQASLGRMGLPPLVLPVLTQGAIEQMVSSHRDTGRTRKTPKKGSGRRSDKGTPPRA